MQRLMRRCTGIMMSCIVLWGCSPSSQDKLHKEIVQVRKEAQLKAESLSKELREMYATKLFPGSFMLELRGQTLRAGIVWTDETWAGLDSLFSLNQFTYAPQLCRKDILPLYLKAAAIDTPQTWWDGHTQCDYLDLIDSMVRCSQPLTQYTNPSLAQLEQLRAAQVFGRLAIHLTEIKDRYTYRDVDWEIDQLLAAGDTIPNLLNILHTTQAELEEYRRMGRINDCARRLSDTYKDQERYISNGYFSKAMGDAVRSLAKGGVRADSMASVLGIPGTWIDWALTQADTSVAAAQ